jgi:hypothetical protein
MVLTMVPIMGDGTMARLVLGSTPSSLVCRIWTWQRRLATWLLILLFLRLGVSPRVGTVYET